MAPLNTLQTFTPREKYHAKINKLLIDLEVIRREDGQLLSIDELERLDLKIWVLRGVVRTSVKESSLGRFHKENPPGNTTFDP